MVQKPYIFADSDCGGIIHIANIKGGVGKTTVATNLAASLSRRGPTLIVDLDVQGSASAALGRETAEPGRSSWELFRRRFAAFPHPPEAEGGLWTWFLRVFHRAEAVLFSQFVGRGALKPYVISVEENLDLIPANADLFKTPSLFQIHNLLYNLKLARQHYHYVVIDTPSVWNRVTRYLYRNADLNLIPVTLSALSTKSLRDYLASVRSLVQHNPSVRIRIVKNEVYGRQDSKIKGKIRTMNENRRYLDNLCEQVLYPSKHGFSSLPQSIIFDLEIPESAIILDAQDEGKVIAGYQHSSAAAKAFEGLGNRVRYVLNMPVYKTSGLIDRIAATKWVPRLAALAVIVTIFSFNAPVVQSTAPRPVAPQELAIPMGGMFIHSFERPEPINRYAKHAISLFRAKVPRMHEVEEFIQEVVSVHNLTQAGSQPQIISSDYVPAGTKVCFFPPSKILNPEENELVPVYRYFMKLVDDPFPYVTGDWCERGSGGGQPHYGMDVAASLGTKIRSPIDGEVVLKDEENCGRTLGVLKDNAVIFFCHMDQRFFKNGAKIKRGQALGTVGLTGRTTGPHVHVGYAVKSESRADITFGKYRFTFTDPKLFYFRQMYFENMASNAK